MSYKVLYRKYRPNNFDDIVGQNYIVQTLKNSIISNNISHAYIFSGPRGTGKTSTAKVFAKAINCLEPVNGSPCGECEFCLNSVENPDIIEIDAASNNGVDEIRTLIDNIKLSPSNGKYKVYIIDEVHMLTISAFNALLLTLEEPPAHVVFILATTNIENVPITILSRCQRFDFQKLTPAIIASSLENICKLEKIKSSKEGLEEIAYLSDGGMRDALSLLDQLSKNNEKITVELIEKEIKIVTSKSIEDIVKSLEDNDIDKFLELINEFKNRGVDYKNLIKKLIDNLTNKAILSKKVTNGNLSFRDYKDLILDLSESLVKININVDPYVIIEMIFLDYFKNNEKVVTEEKIVEESVTRKVENKKNIPEEEIAIRINNCFVNAKKSYLEAIKSNIIKVIDDIIVTGQIKTILTDSIPVAASDEYIVFACKDEYIAEEANSILSKIEKSIKEILSEKYYIIFITPERWNLEKEKYIKNIKDGNKYEMIPMKTRKKSAEPIINDVFNKDKVEVI